MPILYEIARYKKGDKVKIINGVGEGKYCEVIDVYIYFHVTEDKNKMDNPDTFEAMKLKEDLIMVGGEK